VRIHRSFAFVDLSGFTALTEHQGDEHAVSVLTQFRAVVREICARRGVRIDKWLGDGAMLVSVDAETLVSAILELTMALERSSMSVTFRSGVTSGLVILHEGDDYIGHAVNVAARLCDVAAGGEVLVDETVIDAVPAWGAVLSESLVEIRGLDAAISVSRLGLADLAQPVSEDPVCGIPLNAHAAATSTRDAAGRPVFFCSSSCQEVWSRRPNAELDPLGSPRRPLMI